MLPLKLVYHPGYDLNLGPHVFPSRKYRLVRERLLDTGFAEPGDFEESPSATDEQILAVHDPGWVERLKSGTLTFAEKARLEIPWTEPTRQAFWLASGGTIMAAHNALRDRIAMNLGGGFHHAFRAHGEGFCALNDIAIAIRALQRERRIERAAVVDCDVHHGNGTAAIFAGDAAVRTLSIHQWNNYPSEKPPSTIDVDLADGTGDEEYLARLGSAVHQLLEGFHPELILYVAGADPYFDDQLGGLALTMDGLLRRDRLVFDAATSRAIPVAVVLAGGYARRVEDTVTIHANTVQAVAEALQ